MSLAINLAGRTALITGAAQGIGLAIGRRLAAAGARIHLVDVAPVSDDHGIDGARVHQCDLSQRQSVQALFADIGDDDAPDVVVNAAGGVCGQQGGALEAVTEQDWRALFAANVDTAMWLAQAAAPRLAARGGGRIVFIASGAGLRPSLTGIQGYTAAKHALVGLTRQLAQDLGPANITCNAIAPGFVRSNPSTERQWQSYGEAGQQRLLGQIHLRRLGQPDDIAHAVVFLASDLADWITGQILSVDGGRS